MAIVAVGITCTAQTASRMFDVGDKWYYGSLLYTNGKRYDLSGRRVTPSSKTGVYVVDGRKLIVSRRNR